MERFGDDYLAFWVGGCRFVVLNSSLYAALEEPLWDSFEPRPRPDKAEVCTTGPRCHGHNAWRGRFMLTTCGIGQVQALARAQDAWLDGVLADLATLPAAHTVVFSHIPPFIFDPHEPKVRHCHGGCIWAARARCLV